MTAFPASTEDAAMTLEIDPRHDLATLAERFEALGALIERLAEENARLRGAHELLASERAHLLSKNEQARSRVESMIQRLKAMESSP